jgi:hypothetical protein
MRVSAETAAVLLISTNNRVSTIDFLILIPP